MMYQVSSFQVLNCSKCLDPGTYGRRADPWGEYVKRYVPELANMPVEYIYEPWLAPIRVQKAANCIVGKDYPERIVIHEQVSQKNAKEMDKIKRDLQQQSQEVSLFIAFLYAYCVLQYKIML